MFGFERGTGNIGSSGSCNGYWCVPLATIDEAHLSQRDTILVFVVWPRDNESPPPHLSTQATLDLFATMSNFITPNRPSVEHSLPSTPTATPNSTLYVHSDHTDVVTLDRKGPEMDAASAQSLAEVRASLHECVHQSLH